MKYYIDIEINPNAEMRENVLLNMVYTKFHKALVKLETDEIGVSFPGYRIKLGRVFRIHGHKDPLISLQELNWQTGIAEYITISDILNVPADVQHRTFSRVRTNMSKSKLERLKRRGTITPDEEKAYKAKMFSQGLTNPYVEFESGSTKQKFRLFIHFGPLLEQPVIGSFDSYGLSKDATAPWF